MRIAFCLEYPLGLRGGVSVLVETLLRELAVRGHEIILVSPDTEKSLAEHEAAKWVGQHISTILSGQSCIATAKSLARKIAGAKVDVAHFHSGGNYGWSNRFPFHSPIIYLEKLGVPCFSTVHLVVTVTDGYCGPQKPSWFKLLMLPLAWFGKMQQLFHVRCEVAVSQHDFQKLRRWYFPLRERFKQIYHSRLIDDPETFKNQEREPVILNVGHLALRKGQLVLAEAFARIAAQYPEWTLQLVGRDMDGTTQKQILQLISDHHLEGRIQLLGERRDAFAFMGKAAIYVQPSFEEALGLALQEAMFCGCACIGSDAGGIPELIQENKTGLLFQPGNIEQLSSALKKLIDNETHRRNLGYTAADCIRERGMTAGQMAENYLRLYESIRS